MLKQILRENDKIMLPWIFNLILIMVIKYVAAIISFGSFNGKIISANRLQINHHDFCKNVPSLVHHLVHHLVHQYVWPASSVTSTSPSTSPSTSLVHHLVHHSWLGKVLLIISANRLQINHHEFCKNVPSLVCHHLCT